MLLVIGFSAACLTMLAFIPQIFKSLKTKSVKDVSLLTLTQLFIGVGLWVVYGVGKKDIVIIISNTVTLVTLSVLLFLYFYFQRKS